MIATQEKFSTSAGPATILKSRQRLTLASATIKPDFLPSQPSSPLHLTNNIPTPNILLFSVPCSHEASPICASAKSIARIPNHHPPTALCPFTFSTCPGYMMATDGVFRGVQIGQRPNLVFDAGTAKVPGTTKRNGSIAFDVQNSTLCREATGTSRVNFHYLAVAFQVVCDLVKAGIPPTEILVVCAYNAQAKALRRCLRLVGRDLYVDVKVVHILSIDSSQGKEREITVVDFVTTMERENVGYLVDKRRINVALTRAMNGRVVICHEVLGGVDTRPGVQMINNMLADHRDGRTIKLSVDDELMNELKDAMAPEHFKVLKGGASATTLFL
ncbi:hypothetical protein HYFRA_00009197 [Hymenoscyphus fraxineus]|uniref:DNA2/NAM7 helicase-like C-terminal domain-containing protein n=1 Tax=Hymenoscyphus fraxineus TaxID=746836 RepID=A0A9N9KWF5_9HELO|nr:hypothetical protein HYFRA_00009197 [Hymenoscyphus fraxineus]